MIKLKWVFLSLVLILVMGVGGIIVTDSAFPLMVQLAKPTHEFDLELKAESPDYTLDDHWAALPSKTDASDLMPPSTSETSLQEKIPVFYVHPTTYMKGKDWNWDMKLDSATEQNIDVVLANQASAFNSVGEVYAPYYRQSSILSYLVGEPQKSQALDFAYQDIDSAFTEFLTRIGDKPFLLASHSQGTHHLEVLLRERISKSEHLHKMVAAYIIGGGTPTTAFAAHSDLRVCESASDFGCIIHWATWQQDIPVRKEIWTHDEEVICVNPLSWSLNEETASRELSVGAMPFSGMFQGNVFGSDGPSRLEPLSLKASLPAFTSATCRDGVLFVEDQSKSEFKKLDLFGNYHNMDYNLFYSDIRRNSITRTQSFLAEQPQAAYTID